MSRSRAGTFPVALVVPEHGSEGMYGPSCKLCAKLAVEEINESGGMLARELELVVVDGAASPATVASRVDELISRGEVEAVVGWHISAVRTVLAPRIAQRVPYVYTALYEGGERTRGVFLTGETPHHQILPAVRWMHREVGVRTWCVVGNDYVWPRASAAAVVRHAVRHDSQVCDSMFVPLGHADFSSTIRRIARTDCDGVLMFLVGDDAVRFNRQFADAGLDDICVRLTPLMDENMLLASEADNSSGIYTASGYFEALPSPDNLAFSARYAARFGVGAPVLNSLGESCYEGLKLLAALVGAAGSSDVERVCEAAETCHYSGARGTLELADGHAQQEVYIAAAEGLDYDILAAL